MCVTAPPEIARTIENFLCPQFQDDVGVRTNKNAGRCNVTKDGIEHGPVPSGFNGIDPYQNAVDVHELFSNFVAKVLMVYRKFDVNRPGGKGPEQICEAASLGGCIPSRSTIAGGEKC